MDFQENKLVELNSSNMCVCIAMDVVGSEDYKDKGILEQKLTKIINTLNKHYIDNLVVPFQIRGGDEILGVLSSFSKGFGAYRNIRKLAWKYHIELYFGLGFGKLDTGTITDINRINGSAVINACRAVDNYLKNDSVKSSVYINRDQHVKFFALGDEDVPYEAINALVYTIYSELNKSDKQKELIKLMELYPNMTYEEIGIKLGYTKNNAKVNVSKLLSRSDYQIYKQMQKDLWKLLDRLQKNMTKADEL